MWLGFRFYKENHLLYIREMWIRLDGIRLELYLFESMIATMKMMCPNTARCNGW